LKKLSPRGKKITEMLILAVTAVLAVIYWNSFLIYPVKLFTVLLHEASHGLVAFLTGGKIYEIQIDYSAGGFCRTKGGNPYLIAASGYIGSILVGGIVFLSARSRNGSRITAISLAIIFIFLTVLFIKTFFGAIYTVSFAVFLIVSASFFPHILHAYILKILGLICALYTIIDVKEDLITSEPRLTDAQTLSTLTGVPAILWGITIMAVTLIILFILLKKNFRSA
jgi:hypothetical protein